MTVKLENIDTSGWLTEALRGLADGPVVIERDGHPVGALVTPEMLELLERIEDASYRAQIETSLAEPGEIPWEDIKAESKALP